MKRIFRWDSLDELVKAGARLHSLQGVARTSVKQLELDEKRGTIIMEVVWHDSSEAEEHLIEIGRSEAPVCWILSGYASGYATHCMNREVYFVEEKCKAKGDRVCSAIGKDRESWGEHAEQLLQHYGKTDIGRKVTDLTEILKRQTKQIAAQRRQINILKGIAKESFIEVRSPSFQRVLETAGRVAPFDSSVVITGESGVGKEVLARHIHRLSHRAKEPFVAVNCAALPETLLESELFGHKAGAFTGAMHDRIGLFEQADKGTVFLDEIGDITPAMQLKLLRVLQEREVMRVGESTQRRIDVRVLAATNRNLKDAVGSGHFREDLYYRLAVIEIEIPPLRERREDILPMARYFVQRLSKKLKMPDLRLDAASLDYLLRYPWPGNVRELENAVERAALLSGGKAILPEFLPRNILAGHGLRKSVSDPLHTTLQDVEHEHILRVLELCEGNRTKAAKSLGISQATLWRKMKSYE